LRIPDPGSLAQLVARVKSMSQPVASTPQWLQETLASIPGSALGRSSRVHAGPLDTSGSVKGTGSSNDTIPRIVLPPPSPPESTAMRSVLLDHLSGLDEGAVQNALQVIFGVPITLGPRTAQLGYCFIKVPVAAWEEKSSGREKFDVHLGESWFSISIRKSDGSLVSDDPPSRRDRMPTASTNQPKAQICAPVDLMCRRVRE
jgi:hypothetical protein